MALLTMSDGELARADTLRDLDQDRLTIEAAQQLLGLSRRQIFRLLKAYRLEGSSRLISKKRGRPSNRKTPDEVRAAALALVRERYADSARPWRLRSSPSTTASPHPRRRCAGGCWKTASGSIAGAG